MSVDAFPEMTLARLSAWRRAAWASRTTVAAPGRDLEAPVDPIDRQHGFHVVEDRLGLGPSADPARAHLDEVAVGDGEDDGVVGAGRRGLGQAVEATCMLGLRNADAAGRAGAGDDECQAFGFLSSSADSWFARAAIWSMLKSGRPCWRHLV